MIVTIPLRNTVTGLGETRPEIAVTKQTWNSGEFDGLENEVGKTAEPGYGDLAE